MRSQFIKEHRNSFPVMKMCQAFNVCSSAFYRWLKAPSSPRKLENARIIYPIRPLYKEHKGMAGSPMITTDIRDDSQFATVSKNRVARYMREMGLRCKTTKKFVVTTDSKHDQSIGPNILNRQFSVPTSNTVWVSEDSEEHCCDNAVAESFFHTLKTQLTHHETFTDRIQAEQALFNYIEVYYNRRRRYSASGYKSPADFEMEAEQLQSVA